MKIWVDDIRDKPEDFDIHLKTVWDTISFIQKYKDEIEVISVDHDAGNYAKYGGDYIHILDWLEFMNISIPIELHTGNIVGRKNMKRIIEKNNWKMI